MAADISKDLSARIRVKIMIKVLTKRERKILYLTTGVIIFSIVFNILIAPFFKKNEDLNKEINLTRAKLRKYLWLLAQKETIQDKYKKLSPNFKLSGQEDTIVSVLSELENLAKNANIHIVDIRPQSSKSSNLYKEFSIDLRAEGDMEGYLKFIYDIEHSLLSLTVKRLQLSIKPNTQVLEGAFTIAQISVSE